MSKFENIKPGDTVMVPTSVSEAFNHRNQRVFYTQHTVIRVTKTLFVTEGDDGCEKRFYKENGKNTDNNYDINCVRLPSEIYDQSKELEAYIDTIDSIENMSTSIYEAYNYTHRLSSDIPKELADRVTSVLKELEAYRTRK